MSASKERIRKRLVGECMYCTDPVEPTRLKCSRHLYMKNLNTIYSRYGLTEEDLKEVDILRLKGCMICGTTSKRLVIDHKQGTKVMRGLLCIVCNVKLGWVEKRLDSILEYIHE